MHPASQALLEHHAQVLIDLGARYGLSQFHVAGDGTLVATVARGRTYFDIGDFEAEVEALLGAHVEVVSAGAPAAAELARGPLLPSSVG